MKTIEQIIIEYYDENNIPYFKQGNYIRSKCFVHGGDNPTSLSIDLTTGRATCFSKGCHIDTYRLFKINRYYKYNEYKEKILKYEDTGLSKEYITHSLFDDSYLDLYDEPHGDYLDYLYDRGVTHQNIKDFEIRCCDDSTSRCYQRVIIPVRNYINKISNFCMRTIDPDEPLRYKFFSRPKFNLFWNMNNLTDSSRIVITEGVFDAITLINAGIPNVVAALGLHLTKYQLEFLNSYLFDHIIFAYDNDEISESRINDQLKILLKSGTSKKYGIMKPIDKDFGQMWYESDKVKEIYQEAILNSYFGYELI